MTSEMPFGHRVRPHGKPAEPNDHQRMTYGA
jgi:hypothetical protein